MFPPATMVPDWSRNTANGWAAVHGYHYVKGNYRLINDNLLDLSHAQSVHTTTFAGPGVNEAPWRCRWMVTSSAPGEPFVHGSNADSSKTRHEQRSGSLSWFDFMAPCYTLVILSVEPPGPTQTIGEPLFIAMNSATPETERTMHYFWSLARCPAH